MASQRPLKYWMSFGGGKTREELEIDRHLRSCRWSTLAEVGKGVEGSREVKQGRLKLNYLDEVICPNPNSYNKQRNCP